MEIENSQAWGFGAMATPNLDSGDAGYVSQSQATYDSSHDAGDLPYGFVAPPPGVVGGSLFSGIGGIGAIALLAIGAWLLLKR